jgi:hypothetical protein
MPSISVFDIATARTTHSSDHFFDFGSRKIYTLAVDQQIAHSKDGF